MPQWIASIIFLLASSMASSQSLTPILHQHDQDTVFCWTIQQSQSLAQLIETGQWCDSISHFQQQQINQLETLATIRLQQLETCQQKANNLTLANANHRQSTSALQRQVDVLTRKERKDHRHKFMLGFSAALATIIAIIK